MRLVTIVSLGASAVLGLGALLAAKYLLPSAAEAKSPMAIAQAQGKPIVVASRAIKYGEKLEPGMLTVIKMPENVMPDGAYGAVAQVLAADRGGAPVALFPMSPREPILPAKLSGPGARPSVAADIADGMRAYTIKVTDVTGVGGLALPGDRVDVVLMRDLTPSGPQRSFISYVVLQNVRVLGVDLQAISAENKPASPSTATLEVSVEDAQKLSMAAPLGDLSLALRRTGAAELDEAPPLRTADFLVGGRPTPVRAVSSGPRQTYSAILIIEGEPSKRGGGGRAPRRAPVVAGANAAAPQPAAAGASAAS